MKRISLTESQLNRIIVNTARRLIREGVEEDGVDPAELWRWIERTYDIKGLIIDLIKSLPDQASVLEPSEIQYKTDEQLYDAEGDGWIDTLRDFLAFDEDVPDDNDSFRSIVFKYIDEDFEDKYIADMGDDDL